MYISVQIVHITIPIIILDKYFILVFFTILIISTNRIGLIIEMPFVLLCMSNVNVFDIFSLKQWPDERDAYFSHRILRFII